MPSQNRSVFLPAELVSALDELAKERGTTRSDIILEALNLWLDLPGHQPTKTTRQAITEIINHFSRK